MPDYGTDLSCVVDLDAGLAEVTGNTLLAQALARRLITPRGGLLDDPNYGYDLTQFLNADIGPTDLASITAAVNAELLKDERVLSASVTVTFAGTVLSVTAQINAANGPFSFVLAVSNVTTQLLQVT